MAKKRKNSAESVVHRVGLGIALQVAWILLLLALASYSYRDVPMGGCSPLNDPVQNFIGPVGAYAGWAVFQLLGIVGFAFPAMLAIAGLILIMKPEKRIWPRIAWMAGMLAALAILADMQTGWWNNVLQQKLNLSGMPGGWLGWVLGRTALQQVIGGVGTVLLSTAVLVAGCFFVSQTHPAELFSMLREGWGAWQERRQQRREEARADAEEQAKLQERIERERLKTEREELKNEIMRRKEEERLRKEEERQQREADRRAQQEMREQERIRREREAQERQLEKERAAAEKAAEKAAQEEAARRAEEERQAELERLRQEEIERQERQRAEQAERAKKLREEAEKKRREDEARRKELAARAAEKAATATAQGEPEPEPTPSWQLPPLSMLQPIPENAGQACIGPEELQKTIETIESTLKQFGIEAKVTAVEQGPVVTRYELLPAPDVKVERIASYAGNITLALKAESVRVQAPIPGKGVVGIEVPHQHPKPVVMRQLLESPVWTTSKARLPLALGLDVGGQVLMADLAKLPHLLIAGATGMGKTVCMNSLIAGLLMTRTPEQLRLILVDPKIVEFADYNGLPHLLIPVINDAKKVPIGLQWALNEMTRRFKLFQRAKVRDIESFNNRPKAVQQSLFDLDAAEADSEAEREAVLAREAGESVAEQVANAENARHGATSSLARVVPAKDGEEPLPDTIPYIVIIVDELAELMGVAKKEIEPMIQRITQLARATGIHMVLATQRPVVEIITGTIKANVPGRVAFKVAQKNDSRVILDQEGADKLVPKGDMLAVIGTNKLIRAQGAWTKDEEIRAVADFWKEQGQPRFNEDLQSKMEGKAPEADAKGGNADGAARGNGSDGDLDDDEQVLRQVLEVIRSKRRASTSAIQRALGLGYNRAARMMDMLEERGYIGPSKGAAPRDILFDVTQPFDWEEDDLGGAGDDLGIELDGEGAGGEDGEED